MERMTDDGTRPVALVTGVSRARGIGAAVARRLAADGYDLAVTGSAGYDARMPWGHQDADLSALLDELHQAGARTAALAADLEDAAAPDRLVAEATRRLGPVSVLVMAHCESVDSGLLDTTVESFDRHVAVNARATWLLVRAFAQAYVPSSGPGRVVALTSDDFVGNLPYGASKAALDRIVLGAAHELAGTSITANVVNPGPTETGWIDDDLRATLVARTAAGRLGEPEDCANLVSFLCSPAGAWVNGQLLHSNGGFR